VISTDTEIGRHWPVVTALTVTTVKACHIIRSTVVIRTHPTVERRETRLAFIVAFHSVVRLFIDAVSITFLIVRVEVAAVIGASKNAVAMDVAVT
jgi:hypothetical protein